MLYEHGSNLAVPLQVAHNFCSCRFHSQVNQTIPFTPLRSTTLQVGVVCGILGLFALYLVEVKEQILVLFLCRHSASVEPSWWQNYRLRHIKLLFLEF